MYRVALTLKKWLLSFFFSHKPNHINSNPKTTFAPSFFIETYAHTHKHNYQTPHIIYQAPTKKKMTKEKSHRKTKKKKKMKSNKAETPHFLFFAPCDRAAVGSLTHHVLHTLFWFAINTWRRHKVLSQVNTSHLTFELLWLGIQYTQPTHKQIPAGFLHKVLDAQYCANVRMNSKLKQNKLIKN